MNTPKMKGNVHVAKDNLKQKPGQLTGNDARQQEGQPEELSGQIEKTADETKNLVEKALNDCFADEL